MTQAAIEFNGDKIKQEMEQAITGSKELTEAIDTYNRITKKSQVMHKAYAQFKKEKEELLQEKEQITGDFGKDTDPLADRNRLQEINQALETLDESLFSLKKRVDQGSASAIHRDISDAEQRIYETANRLLSEIRNRYQELLNQQFESLATNMNVFHAALAESTNIDTGDGKLRLHGSPNLRLKFSDYSRIGGIDHETFHAAMARARQSGS